ncbi:MAG: hypothetical protein M1819_006347 [Sarea resinae]|nr:MAG: hypothetical protein M1819_006347 [Sarea resinae]
MQDPKSDKVREMTRTFLEDGCQTHEATIDPAKLIWQPPYTILCPPSGSSTRPEYPRDKETITNGVSNIMAAQNFYRKRNERYRVDDERRNEGSPIRGDDIRTFPRRSPDDVVDSQNNSMRPQTRMSTRSSTVADERPAAAWSRGTSTESQAAYSTPYPGPNRASVPLDPSSLQEKQVNKIILQNSMLRVPGSAPGRINQLHNPLSPEAGSAQEGTHLQPNSEHPEHAEHQDRRILSFNVPSMRKRQRSVDAVLSEGAIPRPTGTSTEDIASTEDMVNPSLAVLSTSTTHATLDDNGSPKRHKKRASLDRSPCQNENDSESGAIQPLDSTSAMTQRQATEDSTKQNFSTPSVDSVNAACNHSRVESVSEEDEGDSASSVGGTPLPSLETLLHLQRVKSSVDAQTRSVGGSSDHEANSRSDVPKTSPSPTNGTNIPAYATERTAPSRRIQEQSSSVTPDDNTTSDGTGLSPLLESNSTGPEPRRTQQFRQQSLEPELAPQISIWVNVHKAAQRKQRKRLQGVRLLEQTRSSIFELVLTTQPFRSLEAVDIELESEYVSVPWTIGREDDDEKFEKIKKEIEELIEEELETRNPDCERFKIIITASTFELKNHARAARDGRASRFSF